MKSIYQFAQSQPINKFIFNAETHSEIPEAAARAAALEECREACGELSSEAIEASMGIARAVEGLNVDPAKGEYTVSYRGVGAPVDFNIPLSSIIDAEHAVSVVAKFQELFEAEVLDIDGDEIFYIADDEAIDHAELRALIGLDSEAPARSDVAPLPADPTVAERGLQMPEDPADLLPLQADGAATGAETAAEVTALDTDLSRLTEVLRRANFQVSNGTTFPTRFLNRIDGDIRAFSDGLGWTDEQSSQIYTAISREFIGRVNRGEFTPDGEDFHDQMRSIMQFYNQELSMMNPDGAPEAAAAYLAQNVSEGSAINVDTSVAETYPSFDLVTRSFSPAEQASLLAVATENGWNDEQLKQNAELVSAMNGAITQNLNSHPYLIQMRQQRPETFNEHRVGQNVIALENFKAQLFAGTLDINNANVASTIASLINGATEIADVRAVAAPDVATEGADATAIVDAAAEGSEAEVNAQSLARLLSFVGAVDGASSNDAELSQAVLSARAAIEAGDLATATAQVQILADYHLDGYFSKARAYNEEGSRYVVNAQHIAENPDALVQALRYIDAHDLARTESTKAALESGEGLEAAGDFMRNYVAEQVDQDQAVADATSKYETILSGLQSSNVMLYEEFSANREEAIANIANDLIQMQALDAYINANWDTLGDEHPLVETFKDLNGVGIFDSTDEFNEGAFEVAMLASTFIGGGLLLKPLQFARIPRIARAASQSRVVQGATEAATTGARATLQAFETAANTTLATTKNLSARLTRFRGNWSGAEGRALVGQIDHAGADLQRTLTSLSSSNNNLQTFLRTTQAAKLETEIANLYVKLSAQLRSTSLTGRARTVIQNTYDRIRAGLQQAGAFGQRVLNSVTGPIIPNVNVRMAGATIDDGVGIMPNSALMPPPRPSLLSRMPKPQIPQMPAAFTAPLSPGARGMFTAPRVATAAAVAGSAGAAYALSPEISTSEDEPVDTAAEPVALDAPNLTDTLPNVDTSTIARVKAAAAESEPVLTTAEQIEAITASDIRSHASAIADIVEQQSNSYVRGDASTNWEAASRALAAEFGLTLETQEDVLAFGAKLQTQMRDTLGLPDTEAYNDGKIGLKSMAEIPNFMISVSGSEILNNADALQAFEAQTEGGWRANNKAMAQLFGIDLSEANDDQLKVFGRSVQRFAGGTDGAIGNNTITRLKDRLTEAQDA